MAAINILWLVLACIGSYLLGSIPFSVWIGKLATGKDLREHNTGNPGGFNALRTYGPKIGFPIIFLDQFKGFVTLALVDHLFYLPYFQNGSEQNIWHLLICILGPFFCVIGHNYPVWLKFKGGQGMGIVMGSLVYLNPLLFLSFLIGYFLIYGLFKLSTRTTGTIIVPLLIIPALFIPISPPWNNLLLSWNIGEPSFLFLTQGMVVVALALAFMTKRIEALFGRNVVGVETILENE